MQSERERPLETVLPSFLPSRLSVRPSSLLYFVLTRVLEDLFLLDLDQFK